MRQKIWIGVQHCLGILLGSLITAVGLNALEIPNKIAAGGAAGIATIVYFLTGLPAGIMLFLINIPLLVLSGFVVGWRFSWYSVVGGLATSAWVYLTDGMPVWTDNAFLAALYGGVVTGIGMGIVFRSHGSTGGTDLLARLLNHFTGLPIGQALMFIDASIVSLAGFIFGAELAMYALIAIFVTTRVIDYVQEGFFSVKALIIISENEEAIANGILADLGRGVTYLHGEGGYSRVARKALLVVVSRAELSFTKALVEKHDPKAFVIVVEAHEVLGEGFRELSTTI
jgi:uncharacterized membrane-anchored protein YitT (DUF2179 family)